MAKKLAVVAIGGNSLILDPKNVTVEDQYLAAAETTKHIADMIEAGWDVAIGHGNGPQVGFILRRSEIAAKYEGMHEVPLDVCGADSQGAIGYALQQTLHGPRSRQIGGDLIQYPPLGPGQTKGQARQQPGAQVPIPHQHRGLLPPTLAAQAAQSQLMGNQFLEGEAAESRVATHLQIQP
jgi:hypothetical protein